MHLLTAKRIRSARPGYPLLILLVVGILLAVGMAPALAVPTITAAPNPAVVPDGKTEGITTLTWDAGANQAGSRVWLQIDKLDETLFAASAKGTLQTTVAPGKTYTFKLYNASGTQVLASVAVTAVYAPSKKPPIKISDALKNPSIKTHLDSFIQKISVQPGSNYADVTFTTKEPVQAWLQVSTRKPNNFPYMTPTGEKLEPAFPPDAATLSTNELFSQPQTQHVMRQQHIAPGKEYFFVVKATDAKGQVWREAGSFRTRSERSVKVVFEKIRVINTELKTVPPKFNVQKLQFFFVVDGDVGPPGGGYWRYPRDGTLANVGNNVTLDVNMEAIVPDGGYPVADKIDLKVIAINLDSLQYAAPVYPQIPKRGTSGSTLTLTQIEDLATAQIKTVELWASALGVIDITVGGTYQSATWPFVLSVSGEDRERALGLSFEVRGRVEVTYPQPPKLKKPINIRDAIKASNAPKITDSPSTPDPKLKDKTRAGSGIKHRN